MAETLKRRISAFDIGEDGSLKNRRVFADTSTLGVAPDGICLDAHGAVWSSNPLGTELVRLAEGGEVLDRVVTSMPSYACMLGGADRRTLYCLVAQSSVASIASLAPKGAIESAVVDIPGAGRP